MIAGMAQCPTCGAPVNEGARFCESCGSSLSRPCARCGASNSPAARFCASCGAALAPAARPPEERKLVSILFADVTGSTQLGEQLDPERLRALLRTYFGAMSAVIESWGGRIEKFIGDAVMAVFGVPAVREDDAERAVRAALEMLERLEGLNAELRDRHGVTLQIRIGINTGEVIAPVAESGDQQIVAGDAVNVAARLEQAAEPGSILVGSRTQQAVRHAFRFDAPRTVALKGKGEPVSVWRVIEPVAEPARGVGGLRAALVGRDRELQAVLGLLDEAIEAAQPRLLVVFGPAGIGKSRLVREFERAAESAHPGLVVRRGRCLAAGHGVTYWALGEILRGAADIALDDTADDAQQKLHDRVGELLHGLTLLDEERDRTLHALATTAGISLPGNPLDELDPEAAAAELNRAWPRFATALAARAPTVFVIEDLHWAGDALLDMLERLVARASGPLLVLTTARPELAETHPRFAAGREEASSISLRPLTERQSAELVDGLLRASDLPGAVRSAILEKAAGNPFFLEELLGRLIDEGALVRQGERWQATGAVGRVELPDSVHAVLAARIDALPRQEKRVLQEAAVIGRIFWEEPVARSAGNGAVAPALLSLEDRGLILVRPAGSLAGQTEYIFKHALVRDVAYATLPKARRARAHAEVAAWLEQLAGDRIEEFGELVAHHYRAAVAGEESDLAWADDEQNQERLRGKALEALLAAGASARRRFAAAKAIELHGQALELARTDGERARALEELGDDNGSIFHGDEALAAYLDARARLPEGPAGREDRVRLAEKIGRACARWGAFRNAPDPAAMEAIVEQGLAEATSDEARGSLLTVRALAASFWASVERPDPIPLEDRLAWAEEAVAIAERLDDPKLFSRAVFALSSVHWRAGHYREALAGNLRQLEVLDRIPSPEFQSSVLAEIASDLIETAGDAARGYDMARRAFELARELSDHELMHGSGPLLRAAYWLGRWSEIPALLELHLAAFAREASVTCPEVRSGPAIGALFHANRGNFDRARELADLIGPSGKAGGARRSGSFVGGILARYAVAAGEPKEALAMTEWMVASGDRIRIRDASVARLEALCALRDWPAVSALLPVLRAGVEGEAALGPLADRAEGLALADAGRRDEAIAALRNSAGGFESLKAPFEAARTNEALGALLPPAEREAVLASALAVYEELGAEPHAERVRGALRG
jgi:class 3 adenylate cyclase/tetratricopeptide (TPR) repeat protein